MTAPVDYKPIGQGAIDALNWPLKSTLHTFGWWQIDPKRSFFKDHIASRVVEVVTIIFTEVISLFSKTLQLLRDSFLVPTAAILRNVKNERVKNWALQQPTGNDYVNDIKSLAYTLLNIPLSPIIALVSPLENYNYQVSKGLIPPAQPYSKSKKIW